MTKKELKMQINKLLNQAKEEGMELNDIIQSLMYVEFWSFKITNGKFSLANWQPEDLED